MVACESACESAWNLSKLLNFNVHVVRLVIFVTDFQHFLG
jgi:hypothetical protein